jgi:ABC-type sugar transport system substrate-binding protein
MNEIDRARAGYQVHFYVKTYEDAKTHAEQVAKLFPGKTKFVKARRDLTFSDCSGRISYYCEEDLRLLHDRPFAVFVSKGVGEENAL